MRPSSWRTHDCVQRRQSCRRCRAAGADGLGLEINPEFLEKNEGEEYWG